MDPHVDNKNSDNSNDTLKSKSPKERIMGSIFFDEGFYGFSSDRSYSVDDYIFTGEAIGKMPSSYFDPVFYAAAYADVAQSDSILLDHYILYGHAEGRFGTYSELAASAARIEAANVLDKKYYRRSPDNVGDRLMTDAEHYLLFGISKGMSPNKKFDVNFYRSSYKDVTVNPIMHYVNIGLMQRRYINSNDLVSDISAIEDDFDAEFYISQINEIDNITDPVRHYLLHGSLKGLQPSADFHAAFYEEKYPDIGQGSMQPYVHYIKHGRAEGRQGCPNIGEQLNSGGRPYDPDLPTLVIANHESSRTGAPLVGLSLARSLGDTHNIITLLGRDRELTAEFREASCALFVGQISVADGRWLFRELVEKYKAIAVITNSVETADFAMAADQADLPVISLIHEFAEYTFPKGKLADVISSADRVIVPAQLIRESVAKETEIHLGAKPNNIIVKPQGYLTQPPLTRRGNDLTPEELRAWIAERSGLDSPRIVLGAGYAQIRKGTDLFIQTAAAMRAVNDDIVFLWVGDGYSPESDPSFSVYLKAMIERSGVSNRVFFLKAQQRIDDILAVADVFYLPSRLDPFPNVIIDAMKASLPVICFEGGTGSAEIFSDTDAVGTVVPYANVQAAAAAIGTYVDVAKRYPENAKIVEEKFSFEDYIDTIREQISVAIELRDDIKKLLDRIHFLGMFDATFHAGRILPYSAQERERSIYARRAARGFLRYSPRPGFSDGMYKVSKGLPINEPICALDLALSEGKNLSIPQTHESHDLATLAPIRHKLRSAIHLHLHYPDTLPYFLEPIKRLNTPVDLYVTTTGPINRLKIEAGLIDYERGSVTIAEGPNKGRDIGPFMTQVSEMIGEKEYDVIGHFHGKKSLSSSEAMGRNWRDFLLGTLLGGPDDISKIFSLFAKNEALGLVFAEDRHAVGWNENRSLAEEVAARLKPRPVLPDFSVFPLGNMFWARPGAIKPLWDAKFQWSDYPVEPIIDDGTILHAVERMLPSICESVGLRWATVYKNGLSW